MVISVSDGEVYILIDCLCMLLGVIACGARISACIPRSPSRTFPEHPEQKVPWTPPGPGVSNVGATRPFGDQMPGALVYSVMSAWGTRDN